MRSSKSRRGGFTLIETVVTVGLLAVLAAFVIPTVVQKAQVSDPVKVSNDVAAIGTALQTFVNDTKAGYPMLIYDLTTDSLQGSSNLIRQIDSTSFTATQANAWHGPYLGATIDTTVVATLSTGYGAAIVNQLQRFDASTSTPEHSTALNGGTFSTSHLLYAAIKITGLSPAQAATINSSIDGSADANLTGTYAGANVTGRFRFTAPSGGVVIAYFLATPITQ